MTKKERERDISVQAAVAQLAEHQLVHQNFIYLILGQGTYLHCGFNPLLGAYGREPIDVSLSQTGVQLNYLVEA